MVEWFYFFELFKSLMQLRIYIYVYAYACISMIGNKFLLFSLYIMDNN